jgi:hypothetical protein
MTWLTIVWRKSDALSLWLVRKYLQDFSTPLGRKKHLDFNGPPSTSKNQKKLQALPIVVPALGEVKELVLSLKASRASHVLIIIFSV